jgi:flagellar motor switch protein FliN/FliY
MLAAGGVLVPLLDGDTVRAVIGLAVVATTAGGGSDAATPAAPVQRGSLDLLHDVEMEVTAELGRTRMSVKELLSLAPGAVIELDRAAGGPADLLVNGRLIARGEVVVIDENFGIRITEIVGPTDRS